MIEVALSYLFGSESWLCGRWNNLLWPETASISSCEHICWPISDSHTYKCHLPPKALYLESILGTILQELTIAHLSLGWMSYGYMCPRTIGILVFFFSYSLFFFFFLILVFNFSIVNLVTMLVLTVKLWDWSHGLYAVCSDSWFGHRLGKNIFGTSPDVVLAHNLFQMDTVEVMSQLIDLSFDKINLQPF